MVRLAKISLLLCILAVAAIIAWNTVLRDSELASKIAAAFSSSREVKPRPDTEPARPLAGPAARPQSKAAVAEPAPQEDITDEERANLERIIRERGGK